jgi:hypothetical protein
VGRICTLYSVHTDGITISTPRWKDNVTPLIGYINTLQIIGSPPLNIMKIQIIPVKVIHNKVKLEK